MNFLEGLTSCCFLSGEKEVMICSWRAGVTLIFMDGLTIIGGGSGGSTDYS